MLNHQGLIPLRERQRLIATYDAGETPCSPEQAERQIRSLVQCFEGSHVGILQRCLGVIRAFQKSDVLEMWETQQAWVEAGMDPMAVFVDECHRCGIQAWGSRRMNDGHHTYRVLEFDRYQTKFYRENPQLRLKSKRDAQVSPTYDWNNPEIAAQNLEFLREVAENYDIDGLDLDYTRIGPYFNAGEEVQGREIMNQHVRDVRVMLDEVGEKKGKYLGTVSAVILTGLNLEGEKTGTDARGRKSGGARKLGRRYTVPFCRGVGYTHLDSRGLARHTDRTLSHN